MYLDIPGYATLDLHHLILDYNGTLAKDGRIAPSTLDKLDRLADLFTLHILTADTFGTVARELAPLGKRAKVVILQSGGHTEEKAAFIDALGPINCAAVGNGNNDIAMLERAALGIAVINEEGCSVKAMQSAQMLCRSIDETLDLFFAPKRIVATLRK